MGIHGRQAKAQGASSNLAATNWSFAAIIEPGTALQRFVEKYCCDKQRAMKVGRLSATAADEQYYTVQNQYRLERCTGTRV